MTDANRTNPVRRFRGRNNSIPGVVFLPMWLTGVAGLVGCAVGSRADCLRWLGVFLLPFVAMPLIVIGKWLRAGSVTWDVGVGSFYRPIRGDMGFDRSEQPIRFWLVLGVFAGIAVSILSVAVLLMIGRWQLT